MANIASVNSIKIANKVAYTLKIRSENFGQIYRLKNFNQNFVLSKNKIVKHFITFNLILLACKHILTFSKFFLVFFANLRFFIITL